MTCRLIIDGHPLLPGVTEPGAYRFRLALPVGTLRLASAAARPSSLTGSVDTRLLGLQVFGLRWTQGEGEYVPDLASTSFGEGFHELENSSYRWTNGDALLPPALQPPWQGEVELRVEATEIQPARQAAVLHADAALLAGFESLGDDCELGFVQRHFDATPALGLFRWSGSSYARLLAGLENGFEGLGEPEQTQVTLVEGEYRLTTPYLNMHTFHVADPSEDLGSVHRRGCSMLRLLRRKLLQDIAADRRFFVFKSADPGFDQAAMLRLHAALRRHGPAPLLCVAPRKPGEAAGGVQRLAEGLYAGRLSGFVLSAGPYAEWRQLCFRARSLHEASRP